MVHHGAMILCPLNTDPPVRHACGPQLAVAIRQDFGRSAAYRCSKFEKEYSSTVFSCENSHLSILDPEEPVCCSQSCSRCSLTNNADTSIRVSTRAQSNACLQLVDLGLGPLHLPNHCRLRCVLAESATVNSSPGPDEQDIRQEVQDHLLACTHPLTPSFFACWTVLSRKNTPWTYLPDLYQISKP